MKIHFKAQCCHKIRIISKISSNKSCSELNFVQKSQRANMSISLSIMMYWVLKTVYTIFTLLVIKSILNEFIQIRIHFEEYSTY